MSRVLSSAVGARKERARTDVLYASGVVCVSGVRAMGESNSQSV